MEPTRPIVEGLELYESSLGGSENDQPEYVNLPVLRSPDGRYLSRWKLAPEEREAIMRGEDICLLVWCMNQQFPPVSIYVAGCNPNHNAEHMRECMLLDDGMEMKLLGEGIRRAEETLYEAQQAFAKKSASIGEKLKKECPGSSSTSDSGSGQQNSAPSEG